jgi:hypothetical protein
MNLHTKIVQQGQEEAGTALNESPLNRTNRRGLALTVTFEGADALYAEQRHEAQMEWNPAHPNEGSQKQNAHHCTHGNVAVIRNAAALLPALFLPENIALVTLIRLPIPSKIRPPTAQH